MVSTKTRAKSQEDPRDQRPAKCDAGLITSHFCLAPELMIKSHCPTLLRILLRLPCPCSGSQSLLDAVKFFSCLQHRDFAGRSRLGQKSRVKFLSGAPLATLPHSMPLFHFWSSCREQR